MLFSQHFFPSTNRYLFLWLQAYLLHFLFFPLQLECETDKIVNDFFNDGFLKQYKGNNFKT